MIRPLPALHRNRCPVCGERVPGGGYCTRHRAIERQRLIEGEARRRKLIAQQRARLDRGPLPLPREANVE